MTEEHKPLAPLPFTADEVTAILVIITGAASALVWAATSAQCSGDGTFLLSDPAARPNDFCQATHFAGAPNTVGSVLLTAAIVLTPTLVALLGIAGSIVPNGPHCFGDLR